MRAPMLAVLALLLAAPAAHAGLTKAQPIDVDGERIARSDLQHMQRVAAEVTSTPRRWGAATYRREAARVLISMVWIEREAPRHGVVVTPREVDRAFRRQRDQSFPTRREFRRFLRGTGQTLRDIKRAVRADLLALRIRRAVTRGTRSPEARQRALEVFVADYDARWSAVTACSPRYHVPTMCRAVTPPARAR
jgi:hypothetical protein